MAVKLNGDFYDLFDASVEYPPAKDLLNGVPKNTEFIGISVDYIKAFVNLTTPFRIIMGQKEHIVNPEPPNMETFSAEVKKQTTALMSYHMAPVDVVVMSESEDSYWYFWRDRNSSQCSLGRVDKDRLFDSSHFAQLFISAHQYGDPFYMHMDLPVINNGYISI